LLLVGFESADHPVEAWITRAVELCADLGGEVPDGVRIAPDGDASSEGREGAVGAWRNSFLRAPYGRDALVRMGVIVETFETACTWDRFADVHERVMAGLDAALGEVCGGGWATCRFTHVYPDGP